MASPVRRFGRGLPLNGPAPVTALDWAGAQDNLTLRALVFNGISGSPAPPHLFDMTYIFRVWPRAAKNAGGTFRNYWTTFFHGNYGDFEPIKNFYGCHPYPFDGNAAVSGQNYEISTANNSLSGEDYAEADAIGDSNLDAAIGVWGAAQGGPPSETNNGASLTFGRWYTQVIRAFRVDSTTVRVQFFFDWDLFKSSNGTAGWFQRTTVNATWGQSSNNPTTPCIVIGAAPPNTAGNNGWGNNGAEEFNGRIRGIQIYDSLIGAAAHKPTVAQLADVDASIVNPSAIVVPWYLCLNPKPNNVVSTVSPFRTPYFPGQKPALWTG
jgi:hypothetical protein